MSFDGLSGSEFIHHGKQKYDFVSLVEEKIGVMLDGVQYLLIFCFLVVEFIICFNFLPLDVFVFLDGLPAHVFLFELILLPVFDHLQRVVDHVFLLVELTRMNDHQVLTQIQFAYVL